MPQILKKLVQIADPLQLSQICNTSKGHILRLSYDKTGHEIVLEAIGRAAAADLRAIFNELNGVRRLLDLRR